MFQLYVLELVDRSYYIGSIGDLKERLKEHSRGRVKTTKNKLPFKLVHQESYSNRSQAQSREYQIKKWKSRQAIEKLVNTKK